jgi:predicted transcriptional regulator
MSQNTTYRILKRRGTWMTSKEISQVTGLGRSAVSNNLRRLLKGNAIEKKETPSRYGRIVEYKVIINANPDNTHGQV